MANGQRGARNPNKTLELDTQSIVHCIWTFGLGSLLFDLNLST
jgi:hypothetical protein